MTKIIVCSLLFAGILNFATAQESVKSEKDVFRSDENRLYVNKKTGVYIWLSTSPDPDSEKIRLISDSSSRYTNPMYFDTEGYNTVRSPSSVDTVTKRVIFPPQDIIFEVYADGIAPVSKSVFKSSASRVISGKKFYGNDLQVDLSAHDAVSGILSVSYALNGSAFKKFENTLTEFVPGKNALKYYATDRVGNIEEVREDIFYIDNTPPVTQYNIEGSKSEKYVSADSRIVLTSTDSLAGVSVIYYRINLGEYRKYSTPIPAGILAGEPGTLSFYAEDKVGNKEKIQTIGGKSEEGGSSDASSGSDVMFEFYIDNDPPTVTLKLEGPQYEGKSTFISPASKINVVAVDEKAGVDKIYYSLNTTVVDKEYNAPVSLEKNGLQYMRIKASDYVGNTSAVITRSYFCDVDAPKLTLTIGSPKFESRDTLFISPATELKLSANDEFSGTKSIFYAAGDMDFQEYSGAITIQRSGHQMFKYTAEDHVVNKTDQQIVEVYVDDQPPVIHYHFSVDAIGQKTVRDEVYTIYPTNAMLYIAATDARAGGERIEYSINEKPVQTINPVKGFTAGNYSVLIKAYDVLGNMSSKEINFAIEK